MNPDHVGFKTVAIGTSVEKDLRMHMNLDHDGSKTVANGASVEKYLRMHRNPDHDGRKTVAIVASVETVDNIAQAKEKNYKQLILQTLHFYDKNVHVMNAHRRGGI